jgi:hypothetical protein
MTHTNPIEGTGGVTTHCCTNILQLIVGYDANAHEIIWGSTGNHSGHHLLEYLVSTNLNTLNKGNEPTFAVSNRQGVTNLTLGTGKVRNLVFNWHVSDGTTLLP